MNRLRPNGWLIGALLVLVAAGVYFFWNRNTHAAGDAKTGKRGGNKEQGSGQIPVLAVRGHRGNIGVYFTGLGAVTPIYTVQVRSRVDGQLLAVHFQEGQLVKQGDLLLEIDPRPYQAALEQAEGQLARDQAALANARVDLARYQMLVPQKAAPEQTLATQEAVVKQDEGTVRFDQGSVDAARTNLSYAKISAPITGLIGLRLVDPGNIVHAADTNPMLVITQVDPISVIFTLSEDQLPQVLDKIRAKQTLPVEAWQRDMSKKISDGTLATVDNQIDQTTGTVRVRANYGNANNTLFPNQFVNARVLVQEKRGVVLVSSAAIQRSSTNTFVYLIQPDNTVTVQNVSVGATEGDQSEITSGLNAGDAVVMTGADKMQQGVKVNPQFEGEQPQNGGGKQRSKGPSKG
jgi:multidrug efflux system membrane fusion protein